MATAPHSPPRLPLAVDGDGPALLPRWRRICAGARTWGLHACSPLLSSPPLSLNSPGFELHRGKFVVGPYERGSVMQVATALLFCLVYLVLQLQASPYRLPADNFVALNCSFWLAMLFLAAMLYKYLTLIQLQGVQDQLSMELEGQFAMEPLVFTHALMASCLGGPVISAGLLVLQVRPSPHPSPHPNPDARRACLCCS